MANSIVAGTTAYITVNFLDKTGVGQAPSSASWKVVDPETGVEIQASTAIPAPTASVEIAISPTVNSLQDATKSRELRRIVVTGTYGVSDAVVGSFDWAVYNPMKR